ncbi:MAG: AzlD domain-containing protein [Clostridia bacterium]|nr:AzlD domain-containing protein [Clostridia bacterium]
MSATMHSLLIVLICAGVTLALRAAPFAFFGGKDGVPPVIARLGKLLPPAIMAALVVYCLKGIPSGTVLDGAKQLLAGAVVVIVHLLRRNTLLSIAVGTAAYMLLIRI